MQSILIFCEGGTFGLGHVKRHAVTVDKIKEKLGWTAKHSFDDALRETVQWYVDNPAWWKKIKEKQKEYKKFMEACYKR